jgi:general L-amino acid transport system permease protein
VAVTPVTTTEQQRPPFWRNVTVIKWAVQLVVLAGVGFLAFLMASEAQTNLERIGLSFSFDFLQDPVGFRIFEGISTEPTSGFEALKVGMVNMGRITASGIVAATVLGVVVGIARLSSNWVVNKVAGGYIETLRNIPLLVQIIFWRAMVELTLPILTVDTAGPIGNWFYVSNKGISFAWLFPADGFWQWLAFVGVGVFAARRVFAWRMKVKEETGAEAYSFSYAFGTLFVFALVGWLAHPIMGFLGWILGAVSSIFGALPTFVVQVVLAALAVLAAGWWVKRFLDSRRTPAGLARLTDDDYFRMVFVGILAVAGVVLAFMFTGISNTIIDWGERFFAFADTKFDWLRTGSPLSLGRPSVVQPGRFASYGDGGLTMSVPFFAVWTGVTLYTAAFIAEVVRGGILAVPKGQSEAGLALGLRRSQLLRFIILPQAFRIILPPMGNQYLNLAKNTSLGIAVAYPELVAVGQTLFNQTGANVQVILFWMGFYLTVSLSISVVVNWYNRRLQLVER